MKVNQCLDRGMRGCKKEGRKERGEVMKDRCEEGMDRDIDKAEII